MNVQWYGSDALELTYKSPAGGVAHEFLYRHGEPRLEVVETGRPWSFDGSGSMLRLVTDVHSSLAYRGRGLAPVTTACDPAHDVTGSFAAVASHVRSARGVS